MLAIAIEFLERKKNIFRGSCTSDYPGSKYATSPSKQESVEFPNASPTTSKAPKSPRPPYLSSSTLKEPSASSKATTETSVEFSGGPIPFSNEQLCNFLKSFGIRLSYC